MRLSRDDDVRLSRDDDVLQTLRASKRESDEGLQARIAEHAADAKPCVRAKDRSGAIQARKKKKACVQEQEHRQADSLFDSLFDSVDFAVGCVALVLAAWLFWPALKIGVALAAFALTFWFFLFRPLVKLMVLVVLPLLLLCDLFDRTQRSDVVLALFDRCAACDRHSVVRSRLARLRAQRNE